MPAHHRRDRQDGLYRAQLHRWIQDRAKAAQVARRQLTIEEVEQRAKEARRHDCEHTFIHPEMLLELLEIRRRAALVQELIELHREMALKEDAPLKRRDRMLWAQFPDWGAHPTE